MQVSDGFRHADEVIAAPSIANRSGTSHAWLYTFGTGVRLLLRRAVREVGSEASGEGTRRPADDIRTLSLQAGSSAKA